MPAPCRPHRRGRRHGRRLPRRHRGDPRPRRLMAPSRGQHREGASHSCALSRPFVSLAEVEECQTYLDCSACRVVALIVRPSPTDGVSPRTNNLVSELGHLALCCRQEKFRDKKDLLSDVIRRLVEEVRDRGTDRVRRVAVCPPPQFPRPQPPKNRTGNHSIEVRPHDSPEIEHHPAGCGFRTSAEPRVVNDCANRAVRTQTVQVLPVERPSAHPLLVDSVARHSPEHMLWMRSVADCESRRPVILGSRVHGMEPKELDPMVEESAPPR